MYYVNNYSSDGTHSLDGYSVRDCPRNGPKKKLRNSESCLQNAKIQLVFNQFVIFVPK